MANRHSHKKLRSEIRARIKVTGESYQRARATILSGARPEASTRAELIPVSYFGVRGTLATFELQGVALFAFVPSSTLWGHGYPHPFPLPMLRSLFRRAGVQ